MPDKMPDSRITVDVSDILLEVHISTISYPLFCTFNFRAEKIIKILA